MHFLVYCCPLERYFPGTRFLAFLLHLKQDLCCHRQASMVAARCSEPSIAL